MSSFNVWKLADRPNYNTNIDKRFPYSEVPYLGEYVLLKINDPVPHVDYWGEGKVVSNEGIRGFSDCYNVNHQYQLVSAGPDQGRKIPNRIPVLSYDNSDTSGYINSNSVLNVTVAGGQGRITTSSAEDIARIVNKDDGRVVVYGVDANSEEISKLRVELAKKSLFFSPKANLPRDLQGLTYYDSYVSFLNTRLVMDELYNKVVDGNYDSAVSMVKDFEAAARDLITETVTRLINSVPREVMSFAYKLWHGGAQDIVRNHFHKSFQNIFDEDAVTIANKRYMQPLKLDKNTDSYNDRQAWGDNSKDFTSERVSWKILPVWNSSGVTFKLYNIDCNMFLKLDANVDSFGDRKAWGSSTSDEDRHRYYLEPMIKNGTLAFFIINYQYDQGLKLDVNTDRYGDRLVWGHNLFYYCYYNENVHSDDERFGWIITAW